VIELAEFAALYKKPLRYFLGDDQGSPLKVYARPFAWPSSLPAY